MRPFKLILRFPTGSVLIGGASDVPEGLHGAHAEDRAHRPFLPSTAVRGALRETHEALLRGADLPACMAGTGVDPGRTDATHARPQPCTLDRGARCEACRLFGTQRAALDADERAFSGLVLEDARARPDTGTNAWTVLPGVAMDRSTRSAADKHLFLRRVPTPARDRAFEACGRLLVPALAQRLEAIVKSTTHIGAGRSRGLARVEMEIVWEADEAKPSPSLPVEDDVRIRVTLRTPASIGVPIASDDVRDTRLEIPGAALRGAIGFALAEILPDPDDKPFQDLVSASEGAHFGFLYPVDHEGSGPSAPLPITAAACKYEGRAHGIVDTMLDRLAAALAETATQASEVERTSLSRCPCEAPLRGFEGLRRRREPITTRTVTRASMDRTRGSVRDQHLFLQTLLGEGTTFEGTLRNVPPGSRERLAQALAAPLSLGRGRSSGWGRIDVEVRPAAELPSLAARASAFNEAMRHRLTEAGLALDRVGRLVPITLLSPLISSEEDDGERLLLRALEASACVLKARRFVREGGWDQQKGKMEPVVATAAGGLFVLDLGPDRGVKDVLARLERLERGGVGERRHQGFGHVLCFDTFLCTRSFPR